MLEYIRALDWKTLCASVVLCYVLPVLVLGTLFLGAEDEISYFQASLQALLAVALAPLLGGLFISLFVRNRPHLHVLLATSVWLLVMRLRSDSVATEVSAAFAVYAVAFTGCYLGKRLRPVLNKHEPPSA